MIAPTAPVLVESPSCDGIDQQQSVDPPQSELSDSAADSSPWPRRSLRPGPGPSSALLRPVAAGIKVQSLYVKEKCPAWAREDCRFLLVVQGASPASRPSKATLPQFDRGGQHQTSQRTVHTAVPTGHSATAVTTAYHHRYHYHITLTFCFRVSARLYVHGLSSLPACSSALYARFRRPLASRCPALSEPCCAARSAQLFRSSELDGRSRRAGHHRLLIRFQLLRLSSLAVPSPSFRPLLCTVE